MLAGREGREAGGERVRVVEGLDDDDLAAVGVGEEQGGLLAGRVLLARGQQFLLVVLLGEVFRALVLAGSAGRYSSWLLLRYLIVRVSSSPSTTGFID